MNCHQYGIIDQVTVPSGQKLVLVRNPWSSELYYGDYSDFPRDGSVDLPESDLTWLNENGFDHTRANNGEFFMRSEDFFAFTNYVTANEDVVAKGWYHGYHLVLDDDSSGGSPGSWSWCGIDPATDCTTYTATIKNESNVTNTIKSGLHTWVSRTTGAQ